MAGFDISCVLLTGSAATHSVSGTSVEWCMHSSDFMHFRIPYFVVKECPFLLFSS